MFLFLQMLSMLAGKDPAMLHMLGINPSTLTAQMARQKAATNWRKTTAEGEGRKPGHPSPPAKGGVLCGPGE
jgi:hypothetical protein